MHFITVRRRYLLFLLFIRSTVFAQDDKVQYDSVVYAIQQAVNAGLPEKIYAMTSGTFRAKMSAEQFEIGLKKFRAKTGEWKVIFLKNNDEKGWNYIAEFELSRQIKLDKFKNIERMNFTAIPVTVVEKDCIIQSNNLLVDTLDQRVERLVRPYIQKGNTAGIVVAVINGGKIRRYSYGTTDKNKNELPDPNKTIFEIGSVTKTFTSLLLAQQVSKGRMRLNDPVSKYLPDSIPLLSFKGAPIQIVHLANHTSGLPRLPSNIFNGHVDPRNPYKHYVADSLYSFLIQFRPTVPPGTVFSYSNLGAGILGTILEEQYHMDFGHVVIKHICKPLGMLHTFVDIPKPLLTDFAQGYNENGIATIPWDLASLKGSGAIRSTLNDMIRFVQAQMNGRSVLEKYVQQTHISTFCGPGQVMGLGWRIDTTGQQTYYHHSGGTGGFRSFIGLNIERQLAVVILSNAAEEVTKIGEGILR
jgi:CubicO group peptidase (beta-lactamase class C family)